MDAITEVDDQSGLKDAFIGGAEMLPCTKQPTNVGLKQKLTTSIAEYKDCR
jgi:hypothetical protein